MEFPVLCITELHWDLVSKGHTETDSDIQGCEEETRKPGISMGNCKDLRNHGGDGGGGVGVGGREQQRNQPDPANFTPYLNLSRASTDDKS